MKLHISNLCLGAMLEENIINKNIGSDFAEFTFPPLSSIAYSKLPPLIDSYVPTPS